MCGRERGYGRVSAMCGSERSYGETVELRKA